MTRSRTSIRIAMASERLRETRKLTSLDSEERNKRRKNFWQWRGIPGESGTLVDRFLSTSRWWYFGVPLTSTTSFACTTSTAGIDELTDRIESVNLHAYDLILELFWGATGGATKITERKGEGGLALRRKVNGEKELWERANEKEINRYVRKRKRATLFIEIKIERREV